MRIQKRERGFFVRFRPFSSLLVRGVGYLYFPYRSNENFGLNFMVARKSGKLKETLNNFVVASAIGT
jgi:hypothetical protein